jgi:predicted Zn-dependent protease
VPYIVTSFGIFAVFVFYVIVFYYSKNVSICQSISLISRAIYGKIYIMLEFVYESAEDGYAAPVAEHAGRLAARPFEELGIPVDHRLQYNDEASNLLVCTNTDGLVVIRDFLISQAMRREALEIDPNLRSISVIYNPAVTPFEEDMVSVNGLSIQLLREAAISTHAIRSQLLQDPLLNAYASHFFAYTAAHEAGHLFGLVDPQSNRHLEGLHCCNDCVMRSTRLYETADYLEATNGAIVFCDPCVEDIYAVLDEERSHQE